MKCDLTGKEEQLLVKVAFPSKRLGLRINVNVTPEVFRAVYGAGGIDRWLKITPASKMTAKAKRLRGDVLYGGLRI